MHTEALHKQNLNTEQLLETEAGTQRNFHKQTTKPQHRAAFRDGSWYAKKLSQTETFTHRGRFTQIFLCTESFTQKKTFTQRSFCPQKFLHTETFMQTSFCTEKSLPIFHHVSIFHVSPSYLRFYALLVNSLRRLVFMSHGVLSVHASSSLPLRRSKLNENPKIK